MNRDAIAKKLKDAGVELSAEALDFILSENGKDIEKAKGDVAKLQNDLALHRTEAEDLRKQIEARDADIAKLKEASQSNTELQQQLGQWQEKYNTDTTDLKTRLETQMSESQQKLDQQARQFRTEQFFSGIPFTSGLAKNAAMAAFAEKNFPMDGDKFLGADDFLQSLREANPAAFKRGRRAGGPGGFGRHALRL